MKKKELAALVPRMKPGTYNSIQVLRFVQKVIKDEPKRMNMRDWAVMVLGENASHYVFPTFDEAPACGTVLCEAERRRVEAYKAHKMHSAQTGNPTKE